MSTAALSSLWTADGYDTGTPLTCVATTYEFDAEFFEQQLLTRFLDLRYDEMDDRVRDALVMQREEMLRMTTVAVLVDATKLSTNASTLLWYQIPVAGRLQHAKVTLLVWERHIRILVSSANLTVHGYQLNREVMQSLDFFNHEDSLPLSLFSDVIRFLKSLVSMGSITATLKQELQSRLQQAEALAAHWTRCRTAYAPNEPWPVAFVANWPANSSEPGVAARLASLWNNKRAKSVRVISPFFGRSEAWIKEAVVSLQVPGVSSTTELHVIAPAQAATDRSKAIQLHAVPELAVVAAHHWRGAVHWHGVRVDVTAEDQAQRALHAKAICIEGASWSLLMTGSSNFTAQGLGVRSPNIEANVVLQFNHTSLDTTLEFDYLLGDGVQCEEYAADSIEWKQHSIAPEEEGMASSIPGFIAAVVLCREEPLLGSIDADRRWGVRLYFDPSCAAPETWELLLSASAAGMATRLDEDHAAATDASAWFPLHEGQPPETVRNVVLRWPDGEALLPVLLEDCTAYPMSAERMQLTADQIQAYLIAGRDASRIAERRQERSEVAPLDFYDKTTDPLRLVTTEGYLLYRMRRLGRAISHASSRIDETPLTKQAIAFRLLADPLGPVRLAQALVQQLEADCIRGGGPGAVQGCVFGLAEIALMLGYAGDRAGKRVPTPAAEVKEVFVEAIRAILAAAAAVHARYDGTGDAIMGYLDECVSQAAQCLECSHAALRPVPAPAEAADVR